MIPAVVLFFLMLTKMSRRSTLSLFFIFMSQCYKNNAYRFISENDEFHQPFRMLSDEKNHILLNASNNFTSAVAESFDADSFQLMIDSGASYTATSFKDDFIKGAYKHVY